VNRCENCRKRKPVTEVCLNLTGYGGFARVCRVCDERFYKFHLHRELPK